MPFQSPAMCGMAYYCDDSFYAPVPLTKVHLAAKVVNFTACVEITQEFVNKEKNPIECVYFFPVEEEAAVVEFTAELEGRKVVTKVKEKEDARRSLGSTAMRGVCVTDSVEESVTPVANPVHSLTLSQAANGSFPEAQSVANILGVDIEEMIEAGGRRKEDKVFMTVWVTMVVMVFLKENCQEEREVWDLVFEKAKKWLENNGAASLPELQQKAKQFVKNLKF